MVNIDAQNQWHNNLWSRFTISIPFKESWKLDLEAQERRQNSVGEYNPLNKQLLISSRLWLMKNYKEKIVFGFSPFAYFKHNKIIKNKIDEIAQATNEIRIAAYVELKNNIVNKWKIQNRLGIEYRYFFPYKEVFRLRYRMMFLRELNKKLNLTFNEELLINLGNKNVNFDHLRTMLTLNYKLNPHWNIEFGYMYVFRKIINPVSFSNENNILLNFTYKFNRI